MSTKSKYPMNVYVSKDRMHADMLEEINRLRTVINGIMFIATHEGSELTAEQSLQMILDTVRAAMGEEKEE